MPAKKGNHLTFDDRCEIEEMLKDGCSFREIARKLSVSPTTISSEVRRNRIIIPPRTAQMPSSQVDPRRVPTCETAQATKPCATQLSFYELEEAIFAFDDFVPELRASDANHPATWRASDQNYTKTWRASNTNLASRITELHNDAPSKLPRDTAEDRLTQTADTTYECARRERAPYICTNCSQRRECNLSKARYIASRAQEAHDKRLSQAHRGIACPMNELKPMVDKVKKLLSQGQSIQAIWTTHADEFPVCERTFYNYVERGVLGLTNLSLPKKVKYAPRSKGREPARRRTRSKGNAQMTNMLPSPLVITHESLAAREATSPPQHLSLRNRRYSDWCRLPLVDRLLTVQMDTVEGRLGNRQCILTLHFVRLHFQLFVLLPEKSQQCVTVALDLIEHCCAETERDREALRNASQATDDAPLPSMESMEEGKSLFTTLFPILLTDRGTEFIDFNQIEFGIDGRRRTRVYYCDPIRPSQKGAAEKNHVELRKILPKGTDFDSLTPADVAAIASHVNSYPRAGLAAAPIDKAEPILPKALLRRLGIRRIPPDDVIMTGQLLPELRRVWQQPLNSVS